MKPQDLSIESQKKICAQHVTHFQKLIDLGRSDTPAARSVRVLECEAYHATWLAGATALDAGLPLPKDTADEMADALYSGDADDCLTPAELAKLNAELEEGDDSPS